MSRTREKRTKKLFRGLVRGLGIEHLLADYRKRLDRVGAVDRQNQLLLLHAYRSMNGRAPSWQDIEFRSFSQNGEDGVLLFLFARIGMESRVSVEVGSGSGVECNTANLIVNHGFRGLLVDARERKLALGRRFYAGCRDTRLHQPRIVHAWVTRENIDGIIRDAEFTGAADLLSIDVDGMDYWIWEAIGSVDPRIVVIEYNPAFAAHQRVTFAYDADFAADVRVGGASLGALVALGRHKGYRLVGCDQHRINAFFVRRGVGEDVLPEVDPAPYADTEAAPLPPGWTSV